MLQQTYQQLWGQSMTPYVVFYLLKKHLEISILFIAIYISDYMWGKVTSTGWTIMNPKEVVWMQSCLCNEETKLWGPYTVPPLFVCSVWWRSKDIHVLYWEHTVKSSRPLNPFINSPISIFLSTFMSTII